ncbi:hypothetical protein CYQ88_10140 [Hydrogenovibrio sp. SC-1]|nr:hypothetical protein CYQ88_10140 [Hydrogenovibrio sp. SC-1]
MWLSGQLNTKNDRQKTMEVSFADAPPRQINFHLGRFKFSQRLDVSTVSLASVLKIWEFLFTTNWLGQLVCLQLQNKSSLNVNDYFVLKHFILLNAQTMLSHRHQQKVREPYLFFLLVLLSCIAEQALTFGYG